MRNFGNGLLKGLVLAFVVAPLATAFADTSVTDIDHATGADGSVKITLQTSGDEPQVSVFATENPPRIVLDLADTQNNAGSGDVMVGQGAVHKYSALTASGRTRLVVDLSQSVAYDYSADNGQVVLALAAGAGAASAASSPTSMAGGAAVEAIDFRLGENGQARLIIRTNKPGANLSIQENPESLTIDLLGASLPESLDQRLDVMDFATPVQFIDSYGVSSGVRLDVTTTGLYEHMSFESGNDYIVEVSELKRTAQVAEEEVVKFFEEKTYEGTKVTFNFQDIPVRSVLQLIADVSDLNIVVADSVGGNLTLRLTNLNWDQALDIVLFARNLDMS